ncbi:hypothetical protein BGW41_003457 [Actinomortierella wolfii]|nr:hypothetical protein BGW41_003457 [Actinomortierella wolfii]
MQNIQVPTLTLPESFLEDQVDYAEYYSDVALSSPQLMPNQLHQFRNNSISASSNSSHPSLHQISTTGLAQDSPSRQGTVFLPSPMMSPTLSPLVGEMANLQLESSPAPSGLPRPRGQYSSQPLQFQDPQMLQNQPVPRGNRANSISTVSTDESCTSRNSLVPRSHTDPSRPIPENFYQGQPHVPVESFLMPRQDQYPPDSMILFGGTASHSEGKLFRKDAKEYLMLTNSSMLRYKSMEKASKIFGNQSIWSSTSGHQLLTPQQTELITKEHRLLTLSSLVAVYRSHPSGQTPMINVEYLAPISSQPASMTFCPTDDHADQWLQEMRQGCNYHVPQAAMIPKGSRQRQWVVDKMREDYIDLPSNVAENDPTALAAGGMWRAYFRSQRIKGVPSIDNDPSPSKVPLESKVVVIAVGTYFIHILPHNLGNGSNKEDMKDERLILQYPVLTVRAIQYQERDDTFSLTFGTPLRQRSVVITFASARAREIIIAIRARIESLRWLYPLSRKGVDLYMANDMARPIPVPSKAYASDLGFEDLLRAECHAMNVDRKVFQNNKVDAFSIQMNKPSEGNDQLRDYSVDEMKILLRSLRYNTTFKEISFHGLNFAALTKPKPLKDGTVRHGLRVDQELYELIMSNPQLRSLDLHGCGLDTNAMGSIGRAIKDAYASGLRLEKLDLGNNNGSDGADIMTLAKGIVKHAGTLNYLDVGNCQITGDGINQIMHAFVANPDVASHTLETLNIHGNSESKVNSFILDMFLKHAMRLEGLNLSELTSWSKSPILMAETLAHCGGCLARLDLSGVALHPTTLDQLLLFISSDGFASMEMLRVEGCGLDGMQLSSILEAIGQSRNLKLEFHAGKNLISSGGDLPQSLVTVLSSDDTPTGLGLRRTLWGENALRQLFTALAQNRTLKKLDLSAVSLASGRDPDVESCKLLGQMLSAPAARLEELSIRGEETTDLVARMGKNLWRAFQGIGASRYLTKLDVRRNRFGDEGAKALAEALRVNQSLAWLAMDDNDVTVIGFNAILSAFHQGGTEQVPTNSPHFNSTLTYFDPPLRDYDKRCEELQELMLEGYKTEQETRFMLIHSAGKDAKEWKERLNQNIRQRNNHSDEIERLKRALDGIAAAVDRNKAAMEVLFRDRARRRERE